MRPQERGRVAFFLALGAAIALAQTMGLVAAEGLLLARLGAARLPLAWLLASAATLAASLLYAQRVGSVRNDRVLVELLLVAVALAGGLAAATALGGGSALTAAAPVGLVCLQIAAQAILVAHYWELAGDYFDRLALRRLRGLLTAGIAGGAALGGALAFALADTLPPAALVAAWAFLLAAVALLLHRMRPALRRWSPLGLEEDAGSLAGARAAARWLVRSRLGVALLAATLAGVGAASVARLQSAEGFVLAYPDEGGLLRFLALYHALSNLAEVALVLGLVPRLVARVGVPAAGLLQPLVLLAAALGLVASPRLPAAIAARASGDALESAVASPIRSLLLEAVPLRFRARTSAFLDGIVAYAALGLAGGALVLLQGGGRETVALAGVALAALSVALHLALRHGYVEALVGELGAGRLDLRAVGRELGRREVVRLAALWRAGLREAQAGDAASGALLRPLLPLAPFLGGRGFVADLRAGLEHRSAAVRAACVAALCAPAPLSEPERRGVLSRALDDASAEVRLAALAAVPGEASAPPAIAGRLFARLQDPDPAVRAAAAARAGDLGVAVLRASARDRDVQVAVAALDRLPAALAAEAAERADDGEAAIRAAALRFAARHPAALQLPREKLEGDLGHRDAGVRRAAVQVLAAAHGARAATALAGRLGDPDAGVRRELVSAFGALGEAGHAAVVAALADEPSAQARLTGYDALEAMGTPATRVSLLLELRARVFEAWSSTLALHALPLDGDPAQRFLRAAESDALRSALRESFHLLGRLEDPDVVRAVERTLFHGPERLRPGALEVLAHLGERESAWRLALLLEPGPLEEKLRTLSGFLTPIGNADDVVRRAARSPERWLRLAAARAAGRLDPVKEKWMDRLVFLRQIPLFATLGLDQLEATLRIAREEEYVEGEEVVRQGDPGEQLYLVMEGELAVWHDWHGSAPVRLNTLGPGSYFGDIAILDRAPRSASVLATRPSRLLVLEGTLFRELILDRPEIAFEVFHVLAERLRAAEQRIAS